MKYIFLQTCCDDVIRHVWGQALNDIIGKHYTYFTTHMLYRAFRNGHVTSEVVKKKRKSGELGRGVYLFLVLKKTYKNSNLHVGKYFYEDTVFATLWLLRQWSRENFF